MGRVAKPLNRGYSITTASEPEMARTWAVLRDLVEGDHREMALGPKERSDVKSIYANFGELELWLDIRLG